MPLDFNYSYIGAIFTGNALNSVLMTIEVVLFVHYMRSENYQTDSKPLRALVFCMSTLRRRNRASLDLDIVPLDLNGFATGVIILLVQS
ncbi:hypothetical protein C8R44DRAFT_884663 [Mycena epipterygia]|nr:hypothetical protein C8R44DRAFT_884663 [Mycena epipterygia]